MALMAQEPDAAQPATASVPDRGVPEIHAHEAGRKYKVIDLDNNAIERTAAELVMASKLLSNQDLWAANFRATIGRVRAWCQDHAGVLLMALVDIRSTKIMFYFVPESDSYDLGLGNAMTDLEIELGGGGIGPVETLQVPARSIDRFAGPRSLAAWTRLPASPPSEPPLGTPA